MNENFTILSSEFKIQENEFLTHITNNTTTYANKILTIKISDALFNFRSCSLSITMDKDVVYWFGTSMLPLSKTVKIDIYDNDILIYTKVIKFSDEPDYSVLDVMPSCFNYRNYNIDASSIYDVFYKKDYDGDIKVEKGDIVVDIGSNIGAFIYSAIYKSAAKIYSCEPENNCFKILNDQFQFYPHIYLNNAAISSSSSIKTLMVMEKTSGGNFMSENENISWHDRNKNAQSVKTYSFSDFIKKNEINYIDFLKCDCEGGEHYIFIDENAEFFRNKVNKIALEYHGSFEKIIDFLKVNNFTILRFDQYTNIGIIHAKNNSQIQK
jgi:FkbM family methyltransferase